jgi:uncharacterized phage-like protein YoqJ
MILAGTGHRPNKLGGFHLPNPTYNYLCQEIEKVLLELKPSQVISGFALGFDQWLAHLAIQQGIPVIAAVPFVGQESIWPEASQKTYRKLLAKATEVVIVSEGGYAAYKLQIRNEWMVNKCDTLLACFRSNETSGGTYNCLQYAKSVNKNIIVIDPNDKEKN